MGWAFAVFRVFGLDCLLSTVVSNLNSCLCSCSYLISCSCSILISIGFRSATDAANHPLPRFSSPSSSSCSAWLPSASSQPPSPQSAQSLPRTAPTAHPTGSSAIAASSPHTLPAPPTPHFSASLPPQSKSAATAVLGSPRSRAASPRIDSATGSSARFASSRSARASKRPPAMIGRTLESVPRLLRRKEIRCGNNRGDWRERRWRSRSSRREPRGKRGKSWKRWQ